MSLSNTNGRRTIDYTHRSRRYRSTNGRIDSSRSLVYRLSRSKMSLRIVSVPSTSSDRSSSSPIMLLSKKREQNRHAAARYRDKRKLSWNHLRKQMKRFENDNNRLRHSAAQLEDEIRIWRAKLLGDHFDNK